jgi:hypothetical protein
VAVREPRQRGIGKVGWKAFTDFHEVFKEANLDGVVRTAVPRSFYRFESRFVAGCCDVIMSGVPGGGT